MLWYQQKTTRPSNSRGQGDSMPKSSTPITEEITPDDITHWREEDVANLAYSDEDARERMLFERAQQIEEKEQKKEKSKPKSDLLELVGTTTIPRTTTKFIANKHFVRDTSDTATAKISYLGDNFTSWFLDKTED